MKTADLKNLDIQALKNEIFSSKTELFNLNLNLSVGQVKDCSQPSKVRKHIARASMYLAEKMKENKQQNK